MSVGKKTMDVRKGTEVLGAKNIKQKRRQKILNAHTFTGKIKVEAIAVCQDLLH
jgi:hypothetical protein